MEKEEKLSAPISFFLKKKDGLSNILSYQLKRRISMASSIPSPTAPTVRFTQFSLPEKSSVNKILGDPSRTDEQRKLRGLFSNKIARDIRLEGTDATRRFYESYVCRKSPSFISGSKTKLPDFLRGQVKQTIGMVQDRDYIHQGLFEAIYGSDLNTKTLFLWAKDEEIGKILLFRDTLKENFFNPLKLLESVRFSKAIEGLEDIMRTSKKSSNGPTRRLEYKSRSSSSIKTGDFSNTQPGAPSSSRKKTSSKKRAGRSHSKSHKAPASTHIIIRNGGLNPPPLDISPQRIKEGEPSPTNTMLAFFPESAGGDTVSDSEGEKI